MLSADTKVLSAANMMLSADIMMLSADICDHFFSFSGKLNTLMNAAFDIKSVFLYLVFVCDITVYQVDRCPRPSRLYLPASLLVPFIIDIQADYLVKQKGLALTTKCALLSVYSHHTKRSNTTWILVFFS
jgi:hypothetical protein